MNEKERIIELVKQNIISMEEALDLLEAADKTVDAKTTEDISNAAVEEQTETPEEKHHQDVQEEVASIKTDYKKIQEALVINQQRQREIDILSELDDLSEDMQAQREKLEEERHALLEEKYIYEDRLEQLQKEKPSFKDDVEEMISNFDFEESVESARQLGSKLQKEGTEFGRTLSAKLGNFMKNFDFKDVTSNFSLPSLVSEKLEHRYEFPLADIAYIDIATSNGDIKVHPTEGDHIIIDIAVRFFGKHESYDLKHLEELCEILVDDKKLIFKEKEGKISLDFNISLPTKVYNYAQFQATNGNVNLRELSFTDLGVNLTNGDLTLDQITAATGKAEMVNGDLIYKDCHILDLAVNHVNGDIRLQGDIFNATLKSVNSDFYITKQNDDAGEITVKAFNGDVRLAFPERMNLKGTVETRFGEIRDLINLTYEPISKNKKNIQAEVGEDAPVLNVQASLTTGDILLKYNESVIH